MNRFLFLLAAIGWALGLLAHLLALADIDVAATMPWVWALHIGVFIVWLPAILKIRKNEEFAAFRRSPLVDRMNPFASVKILFRHTPFWLMVIAGIGFVYAIINFMLFMKAQHGSPDIRDGQFILHNHGQLIRTLTEQEYHHYRANELRGFSGHWMAFYSMAAALLFPYKRPDSDPSGS